LPFPYCILANNIGIFRLSELCSTLILPLPLVCVCLIIPHWFHSWEFGGSLSPSPTKPFSNGGRTWATWWRFSLSLLLTYSVGVVIVLLDTCASVPFVMLCLSITTFPLIVMAYSHLIEFCSTIILPLLLLYVCVIIPHWLQPWELNRSLSCSPTTTFSNKGRPWAVFWWFAPGLLLTYGVIVSLWCLTPVRCFPLWSFISPLLHSC